MEPDTQREMQALEAIPDLGNLVEVLRVQEQRQQAALVEAWERQYTLDAHVALVASTLIDATQMKHIDMHHKITRQTSRNGQEYAQALLYRLNGDQARLESLVAEATNKETAKRNSEPINTLRAAHQVMPRTWTCKYQGAEYKFVPERYNGGSFLGTYHIICNGEKIGHLHYFSGTERWQVPNHSQKKDIKKAFADFLDWQKNPRRRK